MRVYNSIIILIYMSDDTKYLPKEAFRPIFIDLLNLLFLLCCRSTFVITIDDREIETML